VARIAVLHNTLDLRGGADAVCLHVCEALQADHEVTLFTLSRTGVDELNELFGTDVSVTVERPLAGRRLADCFAAAAPWAGPQLPLRSVLLVAVPALLIAYGDPSGPLRRLGPYRREPGPRQP